MKNKKGMLKFLVTTDFQSIKLNRICRVNDVIELLEKEAKDLIAVGCVKLVEKFSEPASEEDVFDTAPMQDTVELDVHDEPSIEPKVVEVDTGIIDELIEKVILQMEIPEEYTTDENVVAKLDKFRSLYRALLKRTDTDEEKVKKACAKVTGDTIKSINVIVNKLKKQGDLDGTA